METTQAGLDATERRWRDAGATRPEGRSVGAVACYESRARGVPCLRRRRRRAPAASPAPRPSSDDADSAQHAHVTRLEPRSTLHPPLTRRANTRLLALPLLGPPPLLSLPRVASYRRARGANHPVATSQ